MTSSNDQLREITEALVAMAGLDFSVAPTVRQDGSDLDAVAVGLQALAEELKAALEARQVAEQSNRSKSRFLANMSHELRTPLTTIVGISDLLYQSPLTPNQHQHIERLRAATAVLQRLIEDVLDFSRLEEGALQFRSEPFRMGDICRRVLETYSKPAADKSLQLSLQLGQGADNPLIGDPIRIQQVIGNLVDNAVKYTETGQVSFGVASDRPNGHTLIWVEDTGPGISLDNVERIFERFETGVAGKGIGLGLNIVQQLVTRMKGTVRCVARTGIGARFEVALPLDTTDGIVLVSQPPRAKRTKRVLVVDDTAVVRSVAEDMLKSCGCVVGSVGSGAEAIALLETGESFDLILMDCLMPVMGGTDTARKILERWPSFAGKIVAMSACMSTDYRQHVTEAGMVETLDKPFRLADLESILNRL